MTIGEPMAIDRLRRRRVSLSMARGLLGVFLAHMSIDVSP
jgi:hypothetical protein